MVRVMVTVTVMVMVMVRVRVMVRITVSVSPMRIYRASSLGGCLKAQVAEKLGFQAMDTSKVMEDLGREGNLHEAEVVKRLREKGWWVNDLQLETNLDLLPNVRVQGHVDGIARESISDGEAPSWVLEIKSMGADPYKAWLDRRWDTPGLVQKYKWQVSVYMLATSLPCKFVVKNRNTGKIDISDVETPFYSKDEVLGRVLQIERMVRLGELPDECDVGQYPCPFYYLEAQTGLELTEDGVIETLAVAYDEARLAVKRAEVRREECKKALVTGMADREVVATGKVTVKYVGNEKAYVVPERKVGVGDVKRLTVTVKGEDDE